MEELSALANLVNADSFKHLPPLPMLDEYKQKEQLDILETQGFIKKADEIQIDLVIHFIIKSMARAELVIPVEASVIYCTKSVCIMVNPDEKTGHKLKITPIETVKETIEILAEFTKDEEIFQKIKNVYIKGVSNE